MENQLKNPESGLRSVSPELFPRARLESNERKLFLELTEKGRAMRQQAEAVPCTTQNCIPLEHAEMATLKSLLCKAVERMHGENTE